MRSARSLPPEYLAAEVRNVTLVDAAGRIGVGIEVVGAPTVRLSLAANDAAALARNLLSYVAAPRVSTARRWRVTALYWASALIEVALLYAWKIEGMAGAGNVLTAWIVIAGMFGVAALGFAAQPDGATQGPVIEAYGLIAGQVLGVVFAGAMFWCGHSLLGSLCLLAMFGEVAYRSALRRGRARA